MHPRRKVGKLILKAVTHEQVRQGARLVESALSTFSLPGYPPNCLILVKHLDLGPFAIRANASHVAQLVEKKLAALNPVKVLKTSPDLPSADAVFFEDRFEAHLMLALLLSKGETPKAWYWKKAIPGWRPDRGTKSGLKHVVHSASHSMTPIAAGAYLVDGLIKQSGAVRLMACLDPADGRSFLPAFDQDRESRETGSGRNAFYFDRLGLSWQSILVDWVPNWGEKDPRSLWLASAAVSIINPAAPAGSSRAVIDAAMKKSRQGIRKTPVLKNNHLDADFPPSEKMASQGYPDPLVSDDFERSSAKPSAIDFVEKKNKAAKSNKIRTASPEIKPGDHRVAGKNRFELLNRQFKSEALTFEDVKIEPSDSRHHGEDLIFQEPQQEAKKESDGTDGNFTSIRGEPFHFLGVAAFQTPHAGFAFLIQALARLGMERALEQHPRYLEINFPARVLWHFAEMLEIEASDPVLELLPQLLELDFPSTEEFPEPLILKERLFQKKTGLDTPTDPVSPFERAMATWVSGVEFFLSDIAGIDLETLVIRQGIVIHTRTHFDLFLDAGLTDISIRKAGLDIDPGWVFWLGRVVQFHYVDLPPMKRKPDL